MNNANPQPFEIDEIDIIVLAGVDNRETLQEIADRIGTLTSKIQYRLKRLEEYGYIVKPENKKARSITLTREGQNVLQYYGKEPYDKSRRKKQP